jgi:PKD repeat protein
VIGNSAPLSSQIGYKILTACLPVAVQFTDASTFCPGNTINKWQWSFGDGTTSTLQNPLHSYTNTGSFTVKLTVTTTGNLTNTRSKSIFITNGTAPAVNIGNDSTVCQNAGFSLDAANAGATYLWSTNQTTQTIAISKTGTYWVTVNKNGCIGKDTAVITVKSSPVVNLGKDTSICTGTSWQLDAGNQATSFLWSNGAVASKISISDSGIYWVRVDLGGCSSSDTIAVGLQNPVTPAFGYSVTSACLPVAVKFTDSSIVRCGPVIQWHWDFGDGSTSNQQNPQHSYATSGLFTVLLELNTGTGPGASVYKTVNIQNVPPVVPLTVGLTACKGKVVELNAGVGNASYRWTPATGLSSDTIEHPVLTAATSIQYHVEVTKCLVTQYSDILVSVDSIARPVITAGDTTLLSSEAPFYQWYKDNTALPGAVSATCNPGGAGTYSVKVHNANGCEALSDPFVYVPKSKTGNLLKNIYVTCSPNPGPGLITIALSSVPAGGIAIKCMNREGKFIYTTIIRNSFNRLDLTRFAKGVYFIVMEYDGARLTVPVVTR